MTEDPNPPQEVEATPISAAEATGPTIDVPPPPREPASPGGPPPPPIIPLAQKPRRDWREHAWAALCHLLLFLAIPTVFLGGVITFFVWQLFGRKDPQVEDQGREELNFQINVAVVTAILGLTCLAAPLVPIVWLVAAIFSLIAARAAAVGENYRYPWVLRVVTH
jgi:uncharacterized Tic20 family protein